MQMKSKVVAPVGHLHRSRLLSHSWFTMTTGASIGSTCTLHAHTHIQEVLDLQLVSIPGYQRSD